MKLLQCAVLLMTEITPDNNYNEFDDCQWGTIVSRVCNVDCIYVCIYWKLHWIQQLQICVHSNLCDYFDVPKD